MKQPDSLQQKVPRANTNYCNNCVFIWGQVRAALRPSPMPRPRLRRLSPRHRIRLRDPRPSRPTHHCVLRRVSEGAKALGCRVDLVEGESNAGHSQPTRPLGIGGPSPGHRTPAPGGLAATGDYGGGVPDLPRGRGGPHRPVRVPRLHGPRPPLLPRPGPPSDSPSLPGTRSVPMNAAAPRSEPPSPTDHFRRIISYPGGLMSIDELPPSCPGRT